MNSKERCAFNVCQAAKTIETAISELADYELKKALEGLDALANDMRANIIKICELAK